MVCTPAAPGDIFLGSDAPSTGGQLVVAPVDESTGKADDASTGPPKLLARVLHLFGALFWFVQVVKFVHLLSV